MAKMSLYSATCGTFVFPINPSEMGIIKPYRETSFQKTYKTGVGGSIGVFFSWGTVTGGQSYPMKWRFMKSSTFATLDLFLQSDEPVIFNPQDGSGKTYNAEVLSLDGDLHIGANHIRRKNVSMTLFIKSKV